MFSTPAQGLKVAFLSNQRADTMTNPSSQSTGSKGPLDGLRVLDLSRVLAGPTCTQILGDYGAEILKIERPGLGDDTRAWGPHYVKDAQGNNTQESGYFLCANRNKLSVAVDISTPEGQRKVRELVQECDILVENFKVGGLKKFGLSYEDLKVTNPELIYCSITGFGQTGPNTQRPGYDLMAQGEAGIMSITGTAEGQPTKLGTAVADVVCGLYAVTGVLAALHHRNSGGGGQHIDLGLTDAATSLLINQGTNYLLSGQPPVRMGNQHPSIVPYEVFAARDGHIIVAVGNDSQFSRFCEILGLSHLPLDPRYTSNGARTANKNDLLPKLSQEIAKFDRDQLLAEMEKASVPGGPINTVPEVFAAEQTMARGMKIHMDHSQSPNGVDLIGNPVKFSKTPVTYRHAPPTCGQDTEEVFERLGVSKD